ncbi:hypothetical protein [Streptomyces sp. NRRL WC-3618]|nr:hypothetical protein [Streptomyces sp. NRRL WC-3618]
MPEVRCGLEDFAELLRRYRRWPAKSYRAWLERVLTSELLG